MNAAELYDRDFAEWAVRNAELLRSGRSAEADLDHIAEEIEDMAKRERRAMQSRLTRLIQRLLKWQVQPMKRRASWQSTIAEQRFRIPGIRVTDPKAAQCGEVLKGVLKPAQCKLFGKECTPEQPVGALMVSSEGSCAAYYNYEHRKAALTALTTPAEDWSKGCSCPCSVSHRPDRWATPPTCG